MAQYRLLASDSVVPLGTRVRNLLLLGTTGTGKSSTGNSILLDKKTFKACNDCASGTSEVQTSSTNYTTENGGTYRIQVIDGPGLRDTNLNKFQDGRRAYQNIAQVLDKCHIGVSAFVLVIRMSQRFQPEDKEAIDFLKHILGQDFMSKYGVVVVTGGDEFEDEDNEDDEDDQDVEDPFKKWCHKQTGYLHYIFSECRFRCVLFDNKTKESAKQKRQLESLLALVEEVLNNNGGNLFNHELFKTYRKEHLALMKAFGFEHIKEEFRYMLDDIQGQIKHFRDRADVAEAIAATETLLTQVDVEMNENGKVKNFQKDLKEVEMCLRQMVDGEQGESTFKHQRKEVLEQVKKLIEKTDLPSNPNVCEKLQNLKSMKYWKRSKSNS